MDFWLQDREEGRFHVVRYQLVALCGSSPRKQCNTAGHHWFIKGENVQAAPAQDRTVKRLSGPPCWGIGLQLSSSVGSERQENGPKIHPYQQESLWTLSTALSTILEATVLVYGSWSWSQTGVLWPKTLMLVGLPLKLAQSAWGPWAAGRRAEGAGFTLWRLGCRCSPYAPFAQGSDLLRPLWGFWGGKLFSTLPVLEKGQCLVRMRNVQEAGQRKGLLTMADLPALQIMLLFMVYSSGPHLRGLSCLLWLSCPLSLSSTFSPNYFSFDFFPCSLHCYFIINKIPLSILCNKRPVSLW